MIGYVGITNLEAVGSIFYVPSPPLPLLVSHEQPRFQSSVFFIQNGGNV